MSTHPYIPLYVDDYDAATAHLSIEEDGAYGRLMRLCWRTPGCSLPNDPAWIARKIRLSSDDFARIAQPVLDEFFKLSRGRLVQKRLRDEYDDISRKKSARKHAGKKGGEAKALKTKENDPSNASDLPADTRAFPNPEPEPVIEEPPKPPTGGSKADLFGDEQERAPRSRRKAATPIPEGFPSAEIIVEEQAKARKAGANVDAAYQAERFRNWALGKDARYADWPATWRNWMARTVNDAPKTLAVAAGAPQPAVSPGAIWKRRIEEYRKNAYWNRLEWGPPPGKPGCTLPAEVLMANGYMPAPAEGRAA